MTGVDAKTRCRALVAGFGKPGMRDLDVGRQFVRYLDGLSWPDGVVVEDLSYAAPLVLHRLQELEPAKLVLVGAAARGSDRAGTVRRRPLDITPPRPEEVQRCLEESAQGAVDIDHTLAVARHWGGLPADTVVIEVEPADCSFGIGFSDEMAESFDSILAMVREELHCTGEDGSRDIETELQTPADEISSASMPRVAVAPSDALRDLVRYKHEHPRVPAHDPRRSGLTGWAKRITRLAAASPPAAGPETVALRRRFSTNRSPKLRARGCILVRRPTNRIAPSDGDGE